MKKTVSLLFVLSLLFIGCTGDQGPQGPPGQDGGIFVASAFEIEIDFTSENNYEYFEEYGFDVFPSDVTLVYILWETEDGQDIWRPLPQQVYFEDGILAYNYDFTQADVRFFLDGTINFNSLQPQWTNNQVFRVVVVPADNIDAIDISDINSVIQANNITSFIKK